MKPRQNDLFRNDVNLAADTESLDHPCVLRRRRQLRPAELRDLRRKQSASEALIGFDQQTEIFGLTKGQFSLVDLIEAAMHITGPANLSVSTWTAADADLKRVAAYLTAGHITGTRWLVDFSFLRRAPGIVNVLRTRFGDDAVRVTKNHAKFALIENDRWRVVIRTSMNLNMNPRFEDFTIAHDPVLAAFLSGILDGIFQTQKPAADKKPGEWIREFDDEH